MRSISLPYERADTSPQQRATDPEQGNGFGAGILTEVGADGIREDAPEHADAQPDSATERAVRNVTAALAETVWRDRCDAGLWRRR